MLSLTALITLLAVALYFYTGIRVAQARRKSGIQAPAMTGDPDFERAVRVQANMMEWMPMFLPALWLFGLYVSDRWAAAIGLVWIIGRAAYIQGYAQAANKRGPGFAIQALAAFVLWAGALIAVISAILKTL
jgi:glutathione S-transferase